MELPLPINIKLDHNQMLYISHQFDNLLNGVINYGSGSTHKMMFSILIDASSKFEIRRAARQQKCYSKTLKFHEAMAVLAFFTYLMEIETDAYYLSLLTPLRTALDKKI